MEFYLILLATATAISSCFILHSKSYCVVSIGGKYAVRRGMFIYMYKDLHGHYWWNRDSQFFACCLTDDISKARYTLTMLVDKGTKV